MKTTDTHVYFYTNCFSNWYPSKNVKPQFSDPLTKLVWNNTEEAYMYYKAKFHNDDKSIKDIIEGANNRDHPNIVKKLGSKVSGYNDIAWGCVRFGYMVYVNYLKYSQNQNFQNILLDTGNKVLVEASPIDRVWGVGLGEDDPLILNEKNWIGQNLLGKALMEVRGMLRNE